MLACAAVVGAEGDHELLEPFVLGFLPASLIFGLALVEAGGGEHRFVKLLGRHLADIEMAELRLLAERRIIAAVLLVEMARQSIWLAQHDPANQLLEVVAVVCHSDASKIRRRAGQATPGFDGGLCGPMSSTGFVNP